MVEASEEKSLGSFASNISIRSIWCCDVRLDEPLIGFHQLRYFTKSFNWPAANSRDIWQTYRYVCEHGSERHDPGSKLTELVRWMQQLDRGMA